MTSYEIFLLVGDGYQHVSTQEAHNPKSAVDGLVGTANQLRLVDEHTQEPLDTTGEYLVVPTSNATYLRRYPKTDWVTEPYTPDHLTEAEDAA